MDRIIGWVVAFKLWVARRIRSEFRTAESFEKMPRLGWRWPRYYLLWGPLWALPFMTLWGIMLELGVFSRDEPFAYLLFSPAVAAYGLVVYYGACMYGRSRRYYLRCLFYDEKQTLDDSKQRSQLLALDAMFDNSSTGIKVVLGILALVIIRGFRYLSRGLVLALVPLVAFAVVMLFRVWYYRQLVRQVPEDSPLRQLVQEAREAYPDPNLGKAGKLLKGVEKKFAGWFGRGRKGS